MFPGYFTKEQAIEYINNSPIAHDIRDQQDVENLIDYYGGKAVLPFDLSFAVSSIARSASGKISDYLNKIRFDKIDDARVAILHELISKSKFAWEILQYILRLDHNHISIDILNTLFNISAASDVSKFSIAIESLRAFSVVDVVYKMGVRGLKIHDVVQEDILRFLNNHGDFSLNIIDPDVVNGRILSVLDALLTDIGVSETLWFLTIGSHTKALTFLKRSLEMKKQIEQPDLIDSKVQFGSCLEKSGSGDSLQQALNLYEEIVEERKIIYNNQPHQSLAVAISDVARVCKKIGDIKNLNKSLELYNQALDIMDSIYIDQINKDKAAIQNCIITVYTSLGQYKESLEVGLELQPLHRNLFGENGIGYAELLDNIGTSYAYLKDHENALKFRKQALDIRKESLEENNLRTAVSFDNVGGTYGSMGQYEQSLEYHLKALRIRQELEPKNSFLVAASLNNVGEAYDSLGDYDNALENKKCSLTMFEFLFGENDSRVATLYSNIAETFRHKGDYDESMKYYLKSLGIRESTLGDHPNTATSLNNIGELYASMQKQSEALEYHLKALEMRKEILGEHHPSFIKSLENIIVIYNSLGEDKLLSEYKSYALKILDMVINNPSSSMGIPEMSSEYYLKAAELRQKFASINHDESQLTGEGHNNDFHS